MHLSAHTFFRIAEYVAAHSALPRSFRYILNAEKQIIHSTPCVLKRDRRDKISFGEEEQKSSHMPLAVVFFWVAEFLAAHGCDSHSF